ncbi:hypothetical protein AWV79_27225 [Cupriavidus sp. UYMMa02A]|nr:hypothetical protein AWV79_27225 [Cupriavidus sp. UYMMa02A]
MLPLAEERRHPELADCHVAEVRQSIHRQIELIRHLQSAGWYHRDARALLKGLRGAQGAMRAHRRLIVKRLLGKC